ncbi:MAG TPA: hypothetical protein VF458_06310 [Ktedonobacteraceae bacterium]
MQYSDPNANPYGSGSPYDSPYGTPYGGNAGMPYMGGQVRRRGRRWGCLGLGCLLPLVIALVIFAAFGFNFHWSFHTGPTVIQVAPNPTLVVESVSNPHTQIHIHAGTNNGQITIQPPGQFDLGGQEIYQETKDHQTVIYDLDLNVTGTFDISVPAHTNLKVNAGQAVTIVEGITGQMHLETLSGTLIVKNDTITGPSLLRSNSAEIQATGDHLSGSVTVDNNEAGITFQGTLDPAGNYHFSDNGGALALTLPQNSALQINASTLSGSINSNIPGVKAQTATSGFTLQASVGGTPRAQLTLYSNGGTITVNEQGGLS